MSAHTWDSETTSNEPTVVYIAEGSWPEREISKEEALQLGSFLVRNYRGGVLSHVEIVKGGSPVSVIYHGHRWPDLELLERHIESYGPVPFKVFTPIEEQSGNRIRYIYELDGKGTLRGKAEHILDARGELLAETRMTEQGKPIGRVEYVYDKDGDLILTKEFGPNGELYDEIPSEPD